MKTGRFLATCAVALLGFAGGAQAAHFQLTDVKNLVSLGEPRISPDGRQIAVIVTRADWKTDKNRQEIDLVDTATGTSRVLTRGREDLSEPRWSPDGTHLAFIAKDTLPDWAMGKADEKKANETSKAKDDDSKDEDKKHDQVFVMPMNGGDAWRATDATDDVSGFSWSPDGTRIAYVVADKPKNEKAIKNHDDAFKVTANNFLVRKALTPSHLWVVAANGGKPVRLTEGDFSLTTDQADAAPEPAWSADGKTLAFTRFPTPWWGLAYRSVIDRVGASGGKPETLVDAEGAARMRYAPGGEAFAFMRARGGDQNNGNAVYVRAGGKTFDATADLARNFNAYAWMPDGKSLLLAGEKGTHSVLWQQAVNGPAHLLDLAGVEAMPQMSVSRGGAIAFIGRTPSHADELYVMASASAKPRRLTDVNAFLDKLSLARSESVDWQGPGGFHEDGVLIYPTDYRKGRKYPLVLVIHGGPEGVRTVQFDELVQLLAAEGFLVFEPNYRGSINLGDAYQHAIFRDTGKGPGEDVMAGLAAIEKMGIVDEKRIGVSGWSYGGYMTTWLTGHYGVWKAAVSGAALTDWVMDYTVSFYQQGDLYFFGSGPWTKKDYDIWRDQSPIKYAANVKAPTLIMGDVGDPNVPLLNSYEWYHALRDNGVEVEFYAYPVDTHFPHDIVRTTDIYRRWVGWMKTHLK